MTSVRFLNFTEARRRRCDCCDRHLLLADKALVVRGEKLLGDLDLCAQCAGALRQALGRPSLLTEEPLDE